MVDGDISEVMIDGQNGFISKDTAKDFADHIIKILTDSALRLKMSHRSIELGSLVSPGRQAAKLLRLYQESINHHEQAKQASTSQG
jgi:glycosyltransferase involved in cell wall biosynthesis